MSLESGDQVGRIVSVEVVDEEPRLDVSVGDGDPNLILNGRDRLGVYGKPAELAELLVGSARFWRSLVKALPEKPLEVLAGVNSLGVCPPVEDHREPVTASVDHPVDDRFELGDTLLGLLGSTNCSLEGPAETVLVVMMTPFEPRQARDIRVYYRLLEDEWVAGG